MKKLRKGLLLSTMTVALLIVIVFVTTEILSGDTVGISVDTTSECTTVPTNHDTGHKQQQNIVSAKVIRVIDGDTLLLSCDHRVRLIGVDAPERGDPGADEAAVFVAGLVLNQTVWLEPDGRDTDRHGRLRRYVWLQEPTDPRDESQIRSYQLNALLLLSGKADVLIIGEVSNAKLFEAIGH